MSLAAVVQHVQILEASGLVRSQKVGRTRTCSLNPATPRSAEQWMSERRGAWQPSLNLRQERPVTESPVIHDTFAIERTYPAFPARVFAAFAAKEAKDAWNGDGTGDPVEPGPDAGDAEFDFRIGGHERFGFITRASATATMPATTTSPRTSGSSTATRCTPTACASPSPSPPSSSPRRLTGRR
jgi:hypothetical protein